MKSLAVQPQTYLSLFSLGVDTALICDIGDSRGEAVPIVCHSTVKNNIVRIDISGSRLTEEVEKALKQNYEGMAVLASLSLSLFFSSPPPSSPFVFLLSLFSSH